MTHTKKQQRKQALARRDALDQEARAHTSQLIVTYANAVSAHLKGKIVAGFWPIRSEIDPRPLMFTLHNKGAKLALPALVKDGQAAPFMLFRAFEPDQQLISMGFDTYGPGEEAAIVDPNIVLMPLAAFDMIGNRIGYGGGFYDRTLSNMHARGIKPCLIGLGFNCQKLENIAAESHDIKLDAILTESGLQWFNKG